MRTAVGIIERSQRLHQELLARRVAAAELRYEAAMAELRQVIADNQPDAWQKILEARCIEAEALSEYIAALRAYGAPPSLQVV
jgi:outer membrane PBP1 activator LpoA protein